MSIHWLVLYLVGSLSLLSFLSVWRNAFTGALPSTLWTMTPLTLLALGTNSFISSIPSSMGSLSRLSYLQMSFNRLTGTVPPTVGCLTRLTWIGGANHASNWLIQRNNESTPVKNFEHSPSEENCMTREVLPPELVSALVLGTPIQAGGEVVQNAWHKLLLFPHFSLWMSWIPARVLSCSFCLYPWLHISSIIFKASNWSLTPASMFYWWRSK